MGTAIFFMMVKILLRTENFLLYRTGDCLSWKDFGRLLRFVIPALYKNLRNAPLPRPSKTLTVVTMEFGYYPMDQDSTPTNSEEFPAKSKS